MQKALTFRRFLRSSVLLAASLVVLFTTATLLWAPLLLLSLFFFAVDVLTIDRPASSNESTPDKFDGEHGILGSYVVDATESYGLFIRLLDATVFVDLRRDEFLGQREQHALFLFANQKALEASLKRFLEFYPVYKTRRIWYIGLHSSNLKQGEVFWSPDGYTLLVDTDFIFDESGK